MRFFGLSDVGRKRTENEDRFLVSDVLGYAILADGMGGRSFGEVASAMAVEGLSRRIEGEFPRALERLERTEQIAQLTHRLDEWIRGVNKDVHSKSQKEERYRDMGTTLVCLIVHAGGILLGHVGDSRAYRWSSGAFTQLTEDHSLVNTRVKQGEITAEEARASDQKNIITRAIGTADKVKPEIGFHALSAGDRILLCSDGLSDMVEDARIAELLGEGRTLEETAARLIDEANANGGRDNITAILGEKI